jgi:hypothetical protein
MKSKKARNPGGGNAMSAASGSRYFLSQIIRGIFFGRLLHCGRGVFGVPML